MLFTILKRSEIIKEPYDVLHIKFYNIIKPSVLFLILFLEAQNFYNKRRLVCLFKLACDKVVKSNNNEVF